MIISVTLSVYVAFRAASMNLVRSLGVADPAHVTRYLIISAFACDNQCMQMQTNIHQHGDESNPEAMGKDMTAPQTQTYLRPFLATVSPGVNMTVPDRLPKATVQL